MSLIHLKSTSIILSVIAALITMMIGLKMADSLLTIGTWVIVGFSLTPYMYLLFLTGYFSQNKAVLMVIILSFVTVAFGVWSLLDSFFMNSDAQSGLALIATPVLQWGLLLIASLVIYFIYFKKRD